MSTLAVRAIDPAANCGVLERSEFYRLDAGRFLETKQRAVRGQFFTPPPVARFLASFSQPPEVEVIQFLDPGAGVGNLSAAWIEEILARDQLPRAIHLTACENDPLLTDYLKYTLDDCLHACNRRGVDLTWELVEDDFIATAVEWVADQPLFAAPKKKFHSAILNPPYRKINADSRARRLLHTAGIETSNLYTAFLWLVLKALAPDGELLAITPRSFCNGPYFRPFREALLSAANISRIHVFDSRQAAFSQDNVLQENIIFRAAKSLPCETSTAISSSQGPDDPDVVYREISPQDLVHSDDPAQVIHLVYDEMQEQIAQRIRGSKSNLDDLALQVSTGKVVDFRAKECLVRDAAEAGLNAACVPLIYPVHFSDGAIVWPKAGKKPNYLRVTESTRRLLVPAGVYVLVKRFSAKEEVRRISAAICRPESLPNGEIAFENHLNYFHDRGNGLPLQLASGLATYLNSSLVDSYFRQFSGHTQVNAADLRRPAVSPPRSFGTNRRPCRRLPATAGGNRSHYRKGTIRRGQKDRRSPQAAQADQRGARHSESATHFPGSAERSIGADVARTRWRRTRHSMVQGFIAPDGDHSDHGLYQATLRYRIRSEHSRNLPPSNDTPIRGSGSCHLQPRQT